MFVLFSSRRCTSTMSTLPLRTDSRTDPGQVHERNEDRFAVFDGAQGSRVLLVCDGMGGMGRGDEAARVAVDSLTTSLSATPSEDVRAWLAQAMRDADATVRDELCHPGESAQPGSTAVIVYITDGTAEVCWVGDSRAYHVRGTSILSRTRDHKLVEDLVDAGQMSASDARHSSLAHVVTRALGGKSKGEPGVTPALLPKAWKLAPGDRILLCSDGTHRSRGGQ